MGLFERFIEKIYYENILCEHCRKKWQILFDGMSKEKKDVWNWFYLSNKMRNVFEREYNLMSDLMISDSVIVFYKDNHKELVENLKNRLNKFGILVYSEERVRVSVWRTDGFTIKLSEADYDCNCNEFKKNKKCSHIKQIKGTEPNNYFYSNKLTLEKAAPLKLKL